MLWGQKQMVQMHKGDLDLVRSSKRLVAEVDSQDCEACPPSHDCLYGLSEDLPGMVQIRRHPVRIELKLAHSCAHDAVEPGCGRSLDVN